MQDNMLFISYLYIRLSKEYYAQIFVVHDSIFNYNVCCNSKSWNNYLSFLWSNWVISGEVIQNTFRIVWIRLIYSHGCLINFLWRWRNCYIYPTLRNQTVPIWVHFYDLPLDCFNWDMVERLGNVVETFDDFDCGNGTFYWWIVYVLKLLSTLKYEGLSDLSSFYGIINHAFN